MQNKIQDGTRILYTNPAAPGSAPLPGGSLVLVGEVAAVTSCDCLGGETVSAEVEGVFELASDGAAIAQGVSVYMDASGKLTATVGGDYVGKAWAAAAAGATTAQVNLNF